MSTEGKRETTSAEEERIVSKVNKETVAQKFYRLSGCETKVQFAKIVGYHEMAIRAYLLTRGSKTRKPCRPNTLHKWAQSLEESGGPRIAIGLWPDGAITMQIEDDDGVGE